MARTCTALVNEQVGAQVKILGGPSHKLSPQFPSVPHTDTFTLPGLTTPLFSCIAEGYLVIFFLFCATICVFWMCSLFTQNVTRMYSEDLLHLPSISYSFTEFKTLFMHRNFNHTIVCPEISNRSSSHLPWLSNASVKLGICA